MTVITSYDTLVTSLQETTEDDSGEFIVSIPRFIDQAEDRLFRELDLPHLEDVSTGTLSTDVTTLNKPSDYRVGGSLRITVDGSKKLLRKRLVNFIDDYWPDESETGVPKYYADYDDTAFLLAPTPDSNYSYTLRYTKQPTKLGTSNQTNFYIDNCPDVLFMACMVEAVKFLKSWSQVPVWEQRLQQAIATWNVEAKRWRRDNNITPRNPDNGPNSIPHTLNTEA